MSSPVQFLDDYFPLVVCISPSRYDDAEVRKMFDGYRRYFERGERYALLTHSPKGGEAAPARARKLITDWANTPEVRKQSKALCVGSATVVANPLARGALTAILWLWSPPSPHHVASSTDEAVDWCIKQLVDGKVPMKTTTSKLRDELLPRLRAM